MLFFSSFFARNLKGHYLNQQQQHLRWSSRYLDEPPRPASRWSSRKRLSIAAFSGYTPASTEESPERIRYAQSHCNLQQLSIPVPRMPQRHQSRGSIHSLLDCLRARQAEERQLFVVPDPPVRETKLDSPPAQQRNNRASLRQHKTADEWQMTPAEMKRKTFLRKISLQETHINYNQDYWLQYDKSSRFHTSLDLGTLTPADAQPGPNSIVEPLQAITNRQSDMPSKPKPKFARGDSEPYVVKKKCSCNECGPSGHRTQAATVVRVKSEGATQEHKSDTSRTQSVLANAVRSPSIENLPFLERVGHIETDFDARSEQSDGHLSDISLGAAGLDSESLSEVSLQTASFDFNGGSAFFHSGPRSDSSLDEKVLPERPSAFTIPDLSVSRPSNSPSPAGSTNLYCK